ncbi:MAG: hypothetical protein PHO63_04940 [Bacilli bacterium]|nr:hypothetical protein [Bacilli bacterium]
MIEKIISILKDNPYTIPKVLLQNYVKLNITDKELVLLITLINYHSDEFKTKELSDS